MKSIQHQVLHIEDDPNDVLLVRMALRTAPRPPRIAVVEDGAAAIEYLRGDHKYADRSEHPLPTLVLLDIKIPRQSGLEVLRWIRSDIRFAATPVIMFTSSQNVDDVNRSYALGANAFLVKPVEFAEMKETLRVMADFWLTRNFLPQ